MKYALLASYLSHTDIYINQRIECYLNNAINRRPLTPHVTTRYTHEMTIVSGGHRFCDVTSPCVLQNFVPVPVSVLANLPWCEAAAARPWRSTWAAGRVPPHPRHRRLVTRELHDRPRPRNAACSGPVVAFCPAPTQRVSFIESILTRIDFYTGYVNILTNELMGFYELAATRH